jgi:glutathione synthase/RimK-type ligase-like ATP-grasp enzyme
LYEHTDAQQLEVKRSYAEKFGCDYNDLLIQPAQFTMHRKKECRSFFNFVKKNPSQMWIRKPILGQGGVGITLHSSENDFRNLSKCATTHDTEKIILQSYIEHPLLIKGRKFDIRVYMFIAR